jgi:hypothetical protein
MTVRWRVLQLRRSRWELRSSRRRRHGVNARAEAADRPRIPRPIGPALIVSVMLVAMATAHRMNGLFAIDNGIEVPLLCTTSAIAFVLIGFDRYSVDALLGIQTLWRPTLTLRALVVGALGGVTNLALRRRPSLPPPARREQTGRESPPRSGRFTKGGNRSGASSARSESVRSNHLHVIRRGRDVAPVLNVGLERLECSNRGQWILAIRRVDERDMDEAHAVAFADCQVAQARRAIPIELLIEAPDKALILCHVLRLYSVSNDSSHARSVPPGDDANSGENDTSMPRHCDPHVADRAVTMSRRWIPEADQRPVQACIFCGA